MDLRGDGSEHLLWRRRAGDQRRHPAQRGLLIGDRTQFAACLRIGDRRGEQFGEAPQPGLGIRWQRLVADGGRIHHAPQPALDVDRYAGARAQAPLVGGRRGLARRLGVVVDPRRPTHLEHERGNVVATEPRRVPELAERAVLSPGGHQRLSGRGVAAQSRYVDRQQPPYLLGDGGEQLLRRRRLGDQRRHPPQRGLLVGDAAQFRTRFGVGDRGRGQFGESCQALLQAGD